MLSYVNGNLFDSEAEALVNTVNCVGVMGRGLALQFKQNYPENFKAYENACKFGEIVPGKMFVFEVGSLCNPKYIINFPTKRHWRGASRIEDIETGLHDLVDVIKKMNIASVAIPPLGAGLGGLDWNLVKSKIEAVLSHLDSVSITVYQPNSTPPIEEIAKNVPVPKMTPGRAALVKLTQRYLAGMLDPFVSLLEIHKLMYLLQESGEPLRLNYTKGLYGPYATNLSHVLKAIEGHLLSGYGDGGDSPEKIMHIVPGAERDASEFLSQMPDTLARVSRVVELIDGFETSFGMELLSTVHWVAKSGATTIDEIVKQTYDWNADKRDLFSVRQIEVAANRLAQCGWQ
jgi:O-acetyl-ADP-ribose deacetylase (regulator of RNase III)